MKHAMAALFCVGTLVAVPPPTAYAQAIVDATLGSSKVWLTLRLDESQEPTIVEPEDLVSQIRGEKASGKKSTLDRLGNPKHVVPVVVTRRVDKDVRKAMQKLIEKDPEADESVFDPKKNRYVAAKKRDRVYLDGVLHQFVGLGFATDAEADAALTKLKKDKGVKSVYKEDKLVKSSSDPLTWSFTPGVSFGIDGQWGLLAMKMDSLFAISPGHGYVGILDSGTDLGHPDLSKSLREHNSYNFHSAWACAGGDTRGCSKTRNVDEVNGQLAPIAPVDWQDRNIGHGTHVHGIISATKDNNLGGSGVCPGCSVYVGVKSSIFAPAIVNSVYPLTNPIETYVTVDGLRSLVKSGVQVLNLSAGVKNNLARNCGSPVSPNSYISTGDTSDAYCAMLAFAAQYDVQFVASAGNAKTSLDFPARDPRVLSVGGAQLSVWRDVDSLEFWDQTIAQTKSPASTSSDGSGSNFGTNQWLSAPARDVVSTFYRNANWFKLMRCGSAANFFDGAGNFVGEGLSVGLNPGQAYGVCTGTSMSAPHVSGLVGWYRSLRPIKNAWNAYYPDQTVKAELASAARIPGYGQGVRNDSWGYGVPKGDLLAAQISNYSDFYDYYNQSLTPLFSLQDTNDRDFFFTTVPTMAAAAVKGKLMWPDSVDVGYCSFGSFVGYVNPSGRNAFPTDITNPTARCIINPSGNTVCMSTPSPVSHPYCGVMLYSGSMPKATMSVYTRPSDEGGRYLHALHRFSFIETSSSTGRHFYAVGPRDATPAALGVSAPDWRYDGIEGYVYPLSSMPYFNGTTGLHRLVRNNAATGLSYTLAREEDIPSWQGRGFADQGRIGWVHRYGCGGATGPSGCL